MESKKEHSAEENKIFEEMLADITEAKNAAKEKIDKFRRRVYTCPKNRIDSYEAELEIQRLSEFVIKQEKEFRTEMKDLIESKITPPVDICKQWLASLSNAGDIKIQNYPLEIISRSTVWAEFDWKQYREGFLLDANKLADGFLKQFEDLLDEQERAISDYLASNVYSFKKTFTSLGNITTQKQMELKDYNIDLTETEERVKEVDKIIKCLEDDIIRRVDAILDF